MNFPIEKIDGLDLIHKYNEDIIGIIAGPNHLNMDKYKNLKVISRFGTGLDNIDLDKAKERNILVYNTPDMPTKAVSEFTLLLILTSMRKINDDLYNKKVGIIGYGRIGKRVSKILNGFGVETLYNDSLYPETSCDLDYLLKNSDIITLHFPLNDNNYKYIDKEKMRRMKEGVIIVNTARGDIIDEDALINELKSGKVGYFASDVNRLEKFTDLDNIMITPHIATHTKHTGKIMAQECIKNLMRGLYEVEQRKIE